MRYFKRNWDELRSDAHSGWGTSTWYFETDEDMWPSRQVEVYANGNVMRYDQEHIEDEHGGLSEAPLDAQDFAPFEITEAEFEVVWSHAHPPIGNTYAV